MTGTSAGTLTGTGTLLRLALRVDRVRLPVWLLVLAGSVAGSASSFGSVYPTVADRAKLVAAANGNPTFAAMYGRVTGASVGALTAWRLSTFLAVVVALMNIFLVVRHTRAEEEAGRLELLRAAVLGRSARLASALLLAVAVNVVLAVLVGVAMPGPAGSGFALGFVFAGVGIVFAGVAAVTAQLSSSARTATGLAVSVLAVSFLVRAVADAAGPGWLRWLSPIGWGQLVRPYAGDRWWVLVVPVAAAGVLGAVAWRLDVRRDVTAGVFAVRPGPARGTVGGPFGLAWRLQRGGLLAWTAGFAVGGVAVGLVADGVTGFVEGSAADVLARLGGTTAVIDAYIATSLSVVAMIAGMYTVAAVLRLRAEESAALVEPLLATPVGRLRWAASHLVFGFGGTALLLVVLGAAAGATHGQFWRVLSAAVLMIPAAWVVAGVGVALFGLVPRATPLAWAAVGVVLLVSLLGPVLRAPGWVMDVSPYTHVPHLAGATPAWTGAWVLLAVTVVLTVAGLTGWRRRDVG